MREDIGPGTVEVPRPLSKELRSGPKVRDGRRRGVGSNGDWSRSSLNEIPNSVQCRLKFWVKIVDHTSVVGPETV